MGGNKEIRKQKNLDKNTAEALSKTHEYYRNILNSVTDVFISLNNKWEFTLVNTHAEKLIGRSEKELLGKNVWKEYPEYKKTIFYKQIREAKKTQQFAEFDFFAPTLEKWFHYRIYPHTDSLSMFATEITEQKLAQEALQKSETKYRKIFQSVAFSLWEQDFSQIKKLLEKLKAQGITDFEDYFTKHPEFIQKAGAMIKIVDVNEAAIKLYGAKNKDEVVNNLDKIFMPEVEGVFIQELLAIVHGKPQVSGTTVVRTLQGKRKHVFYTVVFPPQTESYEHLLVSVMDVTHTIQLEKLKEIQKQRESFVSIASHELKTPITALKGYTQLLQQHIEKSNDKNASYLLNNVSQQTERLINLVSDLLNATKIRSGSLNLTKSIFDLDRLVAKTVVDLQNTTKTQIITKKGQITDMVYGDENRIEQVLTNLLTNAIKYSLKEGAIDVHIVKDKKHAVVSVKDQGKGIAKKDLKKIFDQFYRTRDSHKNKITGLGLGLYIASEIITRHKGKIWAESTVGKGTTFYFSLPIHQS